MYAFVESRQQTHNTRVEILTIVNQLNCMDDFSFVCTIKHISTTNIDIFLCLINHF